MALGRGPPLLAALLILLGGGRVGFANGFFIPQQSAASIGRAFAGDSALAEDASTAFYNPAGMVRLKRPEVMVGASLLRPTIDFENRGSTASTPGTLGFDALYAGGNGGDPGSFALAPSLFAAAPLTPRIWLGLAVSAPFGLALDYNDDWFGRYDSIETKLLTLDFAPVVAIDLIPGVLAVGGGLNVRYVDARLTGAVPDTLAPGGPSVETDGLSRLTGDEWGLGFNLGAHLQLGATRLGVHYRSGFHHKLAGSLRISALGGPLAAANGAFDATTDFDTPSILSFGIAHAIPRPGCVCSARPDISTGAGSTPSGSNRRAMRRRTSCCPSRFGTASRSRSASSTICCTTRSGHRRDLPCARACSMIGPRPSTAFVTRACPTPTGCGSASERPIA